jgi:integration host factor subunit alpha
VEHCAHDSNNFGPDATIEITINSGDGVRGPRYRPNEDHRSMDDLMQSLTDVPSKDSGSLTRADLADAVRRRVGLSRAESADHVDAVLAEIFEVIVSGESLKLHSFGSFHVRSKNERAARNPKTGNPATVSARRVVTFKPSGIFRVRINERS